MLRSRLFAAVCCGRSVCTRVSRMSRWQTFKEPHVIVDIRWHCPNERCKLRNLICWRSVDRFIVVACLLIWSLMLLYTQFRSQPPAVTRKRWQQNTREKKKSKNKKRRTAIDDDSLIEYTRNSNFISISFARSCAMTMRNTMLCCEKYGKKRVKNKKQELKI